MIRAICQAVKSACKRQPPRELEGLFVVLCPHTQGIASPGVLLRKNASAFGLQAKSTQAKTRWRSFSFVAFAIVRVGFKSTRCLSRLCCLCSMHTTPVGFEPTRGDRIGLAGRRLNHSAKVSHDICAKRKSECVSFSASCLQLCVGHDTCGIRAHARRPHRLSRPTP